MDTSIKKKFGQVDDFLKKQETWTIPRIICETVPHAFFLPGSVMGVYGEEFDKLKLYNEKIPG